MPPARPVDVGVVDECALRSSQLRRPGIALTDQGSGKILGNSEVELSSQKSAKGALHFPRRFDKSRSVADWRDCQYIGHAFDPAGQ